MSRLRPFGLRPWAKLSLILGGSAAGVSYLFPASDRITASSTLNCNTFTTFTLSTKEPVSSTASVFRLQNPEGGAKDDGTIAAVRSRGVWSVQIKQPQLQIARSYTPLPIPHDTAGDAVSNPASSCADINMLIRRERGGEVSNYLHDLAPKANIELRGPFLEYELPSSVTHITFLAGGTGIAPALQLARLVEDRPDVRMTILWANRKREDCEGGYNVQSSGFTEKSRIGHLMRTLGGFLETRRTNENEPMTDGPKPSDGPIVKIIKRLEAQSCGTLSVNYFVDEEGQYITPAIVRATTLQLLDQPNSSQVADGTRLILVSGPPGFIDHWAGRKIWDAGGETQGPLRGQLGQMDNEGWNVWKL